MKSLIQLAESILRDAELTCATSTSRDLRTIERRVENEGLSFLTITLPNFGSAFDLALDQGRADPLRTCGFSSIRKRATPKFLSGLLDLIFDASSGLILNEPSIEAIDFIRSLTRAFKKIEIPCTPRRVQAALRGYVKCEKELLHVEQNIVHTDRFRAFGLVSDILWSRVLAPLSSQIEALDLKPRHGPGATAERISGNSKYDLVSWHNRLDPYFPYDAFAIPSVSCLGEYGPTKLLEPGQEPPVRVITVPKTLKTPRIIAVEPVCMQYTQQAILEPLVTLLEKDTILGGSLGFTSQSLNRALALHGSRSGKLATLDLSEASDRVSLVLVDRMLSSVPTVKGAVLACRSSTARLPSGETLSLAKFASMGSALCFPIEAMVFLTIALTSSILANQQPISTRLLRSLCRKVRIYGDDIVVPIDMVASTTEGLEAFGLKVNRHKSFWTGKFRESCGMDAYDGHDVTPVKIGTLPPTSRHESDRIQSWVACANAFYLKGYWQTARFMRQYIEETIGVLPHVRPGSALMGWLSAKSHKTWSISIHRWDVDLQTWKVRGLRSVPIRRVSKLDGYGALLKFFLKRGSDPFKEKDHLHFGGRPVAVNMKRRWAQAY